MENFKRKNDIKNYLKKVKKKSNNKGITLIALIITIIVLLILAGVSLSTVFNQDGIFSRAEQATDKYGQAKARETLELALSEAQMQKYESGLTEEQLDNKISEIDGELLPKEKPENPNLQNVIVDGYIFEIDRSVPKIVDYIGPADGIIITAYVTGNDGWVKPNETVVVKGSIKKYGGGTVVSSSATATNGVIIPTEFPSNGGSFTIPNISVDTNITITATDDEGITETKTIEVKIKRDGTTPTVETLDAKAENMKIIFTATGHDKNSSGQEESGIKNFNYEITSTQDTTLEGIPEDKRKGTFVQGQKIEITTTATGNREETTYTIKVTATDNCNNTTAKPKTIDIAIKTFIPVTGIKVNNVYLGVEDPEKAIVTIEPSNATNKEIELEWISSNSQIAEVSQDGTITGKSYGTTTITVTSKENNNINCTFTAKVGEKLDLATVPITNFYAGQYGHGSMTRTPFTMISPQKWDAASCDIERPEGATGIYGSVTWTGTPYFAGISLGGKSGEVSYGPIWVCGSAPGDLGEGADDGYADWPETGAPWVSVGTMAMNVGSLATGDSSMTVRKIVVFYD